MNDEPVTKEMRIRVNPDLLREIENEQDAMDMIVAGVLGLKIEGVFDDDLDSLLGDAKAIADKTLIVIEALNGVQIG